MVEGAAFFLLCHDDVALDPDAVHKLVEESFRSNAGVVSPKFVQLGRPPRPPARRDELRQDRVPSWTASLEGEVDHGQHDAVRDVFVAPGGCILVRADLFAELKGFDAGIVAMGEDLDLSWRSQVAGSRVVVAPGRAGAPPRGGRRRARAAGGGRRAARAATPSPCSRCSGGTSCGPCSSATPACTCCGCCRRRRCWPSARSSSPCSPAIGDRVRAVTGAWRWNFRRLTEISRAARRAGRAPPLPRRRGAPAAGAGERAALALLQPPLPPGPRGGQRRGRHAGAARADDERAAEVAVLTGSVGLGLQRGRRLRRARRPGPARRTGPLRPTGPIGAAEHGTPARRGRSSSRSLVIALGTRELFFGTLPLVGQLAPLPSWSTSWHHFFSGWQSTGVGTTAPASPAFGLVGLTGTVLFGAMGTLQRVLLLGCIPLGAWGVSRCLRPLVSPRARVVAVICYLGLPLPYGALGTGRWDGLVAYAAVPLHRAAAWPGPPAWPPTRSSPGPRWRSRPVGPGRPPRRGHRRRRGVRAGRGAHGPRHGGGLGGGLGPRRRPRADLAGARGGRARRWSWRWSWPCPGWSGPPWPARGRWPSSDSPSRVPRRRAGAMSSASPSGRPPVRPSPGSWWSVRRCRWSSPAAPGWPGRRACGSWRWPRGASPTPARRGDLGSFTPSETVVLAPAALAVAACVGIGIAAFENDLSGREFGWRQLVSAAALVLRRASACSRWLGGAVGGRWDLPSQGVEQPLAFLAQPSPGVSRVLWLGDPRALPAGGWSVAVGPGLRPHARRRCPTRPRCSPPPGPGPAAEVAQAVRLAVAGGTVHLGRLLAPAGVRYVVVVDALAPSLVGHRPGVGERAATGRPQRGPSPAGRPAGRARACSACRSTRTGTTMPVTATRAGRAARARRRPTRARRTWRAGNRCSARSRRRSGRHGAVPAGTLYAGYAPAGSFALTVDGHAVARQPAFGWAAQYAVTAKGRATLSLSQFPLVPLAVLLELAAWVVLALAVIGRPRGAGAGSAPRPWPAASPRRCRQRDGDPVTPAHQSARAPVARGRPCGARRRRRRHRGGRARARRTRRRRADPGALVGAPDAESSAWYCTGQSTAGGVSPGFLVLTNTTAEPGHRGHHGHVRLGCHRADRRGRAGARRGGAGHPRARHRGRGSPRRSSRRAVAWRSPRRSARWAGPRRPARAPPRPQWYFAGGSTAAANALYVSLLNPDVDTGRRRSELRHADGHGAPHQLPGDRAAGGTGGGGERDDRGPGDLHRQHGRLHPDRPRRGVGGAGDRRRRARRRAALSLVPGAMAPQPHWAIPQAQEVPGGSSEIDVFNPGTTPESVTVHFRLPVRAAGAVDAQDPARLDLGPPHQHTDPDPRQPDLRHRHRRHGRVRGRGQSVDRSPATATPPPQAGVAAAVDGLSTESPSGEWVVPPPGTSDSPAVSGAAPAYLALLNTSTAPRDLHARSPPRRPGNQVVATGTLARRDRRAGVGIAAHRRRAQPDCRAASGPMAVSEDVGPPRGVGVVSMPGIPLAAAIGA